GGGGVAGVGVSSAAHLTALEVFGQPAKCPWDTSRLAEDFRLASGPPSKRWGLGSRGRALVVGNGKKARTWRVYSIHATSARHTTGSGGIPAILIAGSPRAARGRPGRCARPRPSPR